MFYSWSFPVAPQIKSVDPDEAVIEDLHRKDLKDVLVVRAAQHCRQ